MSDDGKTHFRKAFNSPYLSSADIVDPITLTIKRVVLAPDRTKKTKDEFNTAEWVEREIRPGEALKPMILNATNSKFLAQLTGHKFIDDWAGTQVTVFVEPNVRFGKETVEGLRLAKPVLSPTASPELVKSAEDAADKGTAAYADWWQKAGAESRKALATKHTRLKARAAEVDQRRSQMQ